MSTRCTIGIFNDNNTITSIYCHHDGYPAYVGKTLLECYTDTDIINRLMDLGDLSSLGEDLYANGHTWKAPIEGVCVAYGRDRGEKDVEGMILDDLYSFERHGKDIGCEYQYLFKDNKWTYRKIFGDNTWKELTAEDCER